MANVIRHFVPAMIKRERGVIVNFSSGWGRSTDAEVAPYCASKWAIEGLTQAFAQELPAGLAAVALNPGIINTEMLRSCFGGSASGYPSPAEWAKGAVPFLLKLGPGDNGKQLTAPNG
jgi:NAD(P)-dependent dehydrogenase (short-subunit alcohol dehydrogenase family)